MLRQLATIHVIYLILTGNPVNSSLTSTSYKNHHGPVIAPFSAQILKCLLLFFKLYWMCLINIKPLLLSILWLYENCNAQGAFVIIFFYLQGHSELPQKPLQSSYYHYLAYLIANYSYNCMKIIIIKEISISTCQFEESLGPPPKFQVKIEIQLNTTHLSSAHLFKPLTSFQAHKRLEKINHKCIILCSFVCFEPSFTVFENLKILIFLFLCHIFLNVGIILPEKVYSWLQTPQCEK